MSSSSSLQVFSNADLMKKVFSYLMIAPIPEHTKKIERLLTQISQKIQEASLTINNGGRGIDPSLNHLSFPVILRMSEIIRRPDIVEKLYKRDLAIFAAASKGNLKTSQEVLEKLLLKEEPNLGRFTPQRPWTPIKVAMMDYLLIYESHLNTTMHRRIFAGLLLVNLLAITGSIAFFLAASISRTSDINDTLGLYLKLTCLFSLFSTLCIRQQDLPEIRSTQEIYAKLFQESPHIGPNSHQSSSAGRIEDDALRAPNLFGPHP